MTPVSPKTGTNMQVSSGAAFGVRGRLLGSGITWFIAIGFAVILVFTSGEAIIYTFNRWFQTSTSNTALSIAMIAVLILAGVSAVLGHRTLERSVRVITIVAIIVGIATFAVFAPKFHVTHGANYLLGSFWPTWFLSATTAASLPISWGPFVGDYGRYIPANASSKKVTVAGFAGIFLGCWVAMIAAAFAATAFVSNAGNFVPGITAAAPSWFLFPMLLVLGLGSNIASAGMSLYNAALDIGSWPFFFRMKRWHIATGLERDHLRPDVPARHRHQLPHQPRVVRDDHGRHRNAMDGHRRHPLPHEQGQLQQPPICTPSPCPGCAAGTGTPTASIHAPSWPGGAASPSGSCSRPRPCSPGLWRTP